MTKALLVIAILLFAGLLVYLRFAGPSCPDQSLLITSLNATIREQEATIASLQHQLENYQCPRCEECSCPEPSCPDCPPCHDIKYFATPEEVKKWLGSNDVDRRNYSDPSRYAIELQRDALADGYVMSVVIYQEKTCPHRERLMCEVIIGQRVFLIDPINDTVEFYRYLP
jgi:hypothetical protein